MIPIPIKTFAITILSIAAATQSPAQRSHQGMGPLLDRAEVKPGDIIPTDLTIYTANGEKTTLARIATGKYTVLVSGCLTCPIFHRTYPGVEAVYRDYKDNDDIQFFLVYKSLAHPELNGYVQAMTLDERLAHIVEAKRVLGTTIDWLCDGMDANGDGSVDKEEVDKMLKNRPTPPGSQRDGLERTRGPGGRI